MRLHAPRYATIFGLALALPCLMLAAFGVRMIRNCDELAEKRQAEERGTIARRIGSELTTRLDGLSLEAARALGAGRNADVAWEARRPDVALFARIRDGQLVLPWQVDSASAHFAGMLQATSTAAGQARVRGERLETLLQFSA